MRGDQEACPTTERDYMHFIKVKHYIHDSQQRFTHEINVNDYASTSYNTGNMHSHHKLDCFVHYKASAPLVVGFISWRALLTAPRNTSTLHVIQHSATRPSLSYYNIQLVQINKLYFHLGQVSILR